jgi:hypothetical protein
MSESLSFEVADVNLGGMVVQPDRRIVQFRQGRKLLTLESQKQGRPVYAPITLFCVRHPGERDETVVEATDFHKDTHPRQWAAFQQGAKADAEGTPLAVLFPAEPFIVEHLRSLNVFTVEMLAGITEEGIRRIGMGAREYQGRAQKFMDAAANSAPQRELEAKLQQSNEEIEALKAQVQLLIDNARRNAEDDAPRRGRPRKADYTEGDGA